MVSGMSELAQLTRAALSTADGTRDGAALGLSALPWLTASIAEDRARRTFSHWGLSTVVDENTGTAVLPRALFDALHDHAGIAASWPVGNAGLLHCYGYLLSLEPTPYGLKRERWTGSALATACGVDPDAFLPWAQGPTLLTRATSAAAALLASTALTMTDAVGGRATVVALGADEGPTALAYAVAPGADALPLLVTLFPVADPGIVRLDLARERRLRWNAA